MELENAVWFTWWNDADWIVRSVFLLLLTLSVSSWSVITYKTWQFTAIHRHERRLALGFLSGKSPADLAMSLPAFAPSAHLFQLAGIRAGGASPPPPRDRLEVFFTQALKVRRLELENCLTLLATTGNAAPFIGLFGTVWGIMHALQGLGGDAALSMDMIAGPVAEALVATAAGLFAAIPAVVGYNLLLRRLRHISGAVESNAAHILDAIRRRQQGRDDDGL